MAGRLRTQLKRAEAIRDAAINLYSLIDESAPSSVVTDEAHDDWLNGKVTDGKAMLWHSMLSAAATCYQSAENMTDLLQERIELLPAYRPPVPAQQNAGKPVLQSGAPPDASSRTSDSSRSDAPAES